MKMIKPNWQTTILQYLCHYVGCFNSFFLGPSYFFFMSVKIDYLNFREKDMTIFAEKKKKAQRKKEER